MRWSERELAQAEEIARATGAYKGPRRITERLREIRLPLSEGLELRDGIWGSFPVTFVRQLYRALGFDEDRVFRWRLEHKLVQALLMNHFAPGCVPVTRGLEALADGVADVGAALEREFPAGFFLKPALGDSSGDGDGADRTQQILCAVRGAPGGLLDEEFLVQERVPIAVEYRVHTLEDRVVEDLTFHRYGKGDIPGERDAPNGFVQSVLDRLPDGMVAGTICGWDVARTPDGALLAIEVNFSGFHPVFHRGFQCSGWFHDEQWGALSVARLVRFLEEHCGVRVKVEADRPDLEAENRFYEEVNRSRELLRTAEIT